MQLPHHGDRNECEDQIGRDVDGRVEDTDVLEDVGIITLGCAVTKSV